MKLSKLSLALALVGLGFAGKNASAVTLAVISLNPGGTAPTLTYNNGVASSAGTFNLSGVNGVVIPANDLTGVKITFTGFTPNGAALQGGGTISQLLNGGTFTLTNSLSEVILTGTAGSAQLSLGLDTNSGGTNNAAGSYFSLGDVIYSPASGTDTLQPAINAAGFGNPGAFSFSLTGFDGTNPILNPLGGPTGVLQPFTSSISGTIAETSGAGGSTPLPAAAWSGLSMMGALGGLGAMARRRRRA